MSADEQARLNQAIGRLEALAENSARQQSKLFEKVDKVSDRVNDVTAAVSTLTNSHNDIARDMTDTVLPAISDYKEKKQRVIGAVAGAGVIGGAAGVGIKTFLAKLGIVIGG